MAVLETGQHIVQHTMRRARDNPFAVDRVLRVRYRFDSTSLDDLCQRVETLNMRGAIVGPQGTGKTTLLEDLAMKLEKQGWRIRGARLSAEHPAFDRRWLRNFSASLESRDLIALDGAEQLSSWAWQHFKHRSHRAGGLLITSHRPALLPTLLETSTSLDVLDHVLKQLVPDAACELHERAAALFAQFHGNIRDVLRVLYDDWARGEFVYTARTATSS